MTSGSVTAGGELFQTRWNTSDYALVWGVQMDGFYSVTGTAAQGSVGIGLVIARNWTVDGSGGTSANLTGNNSKLQTSMASSKMGAIRIAGTSALGAGTKTYDNSYMGEILAPANNSSIRMQSFSLYGSTSLERLANPAPIVLAQNEGLVAIAYATAGPTWNLSISMAWSEVSAY
jgi:hypothetical protein